MHQVLRKRVVRALVALSALGCSGADGEAQQNGTVAPSESSRAAAGRQGSAVVVNRVALGALDASRTGLPDGSYWYDAKSGLWGLEGADALAFARAGLALGGALREDASRGETGVLLNGRNLGDGELFGLETLLATFLPPDRYALDAETNFGFEGEPPAINLFELALAYSSAAASPGPTLPGSEAPGGAASGGGSWTNSLLDSYGGENASGEGYVCTDSGCASYGF
jgi:hypothetical protein